MTQPNDDYNALVAKVDSVEAIPGADRIQAARIKGYRVVVSKNVRVGDLGVLFAEGGQLAESFARANGLMRDQGGYLDANRRIRIQPFRGVPSEGLWLPVTCLDNAAAECKTLDQPEGYPEISNQVRDGYELRDWTFEDGFTVPVCQKYFSPQVLREFAKTGKAPTATETKLFREHPSTKQLRKEIDSLQDGDRVYISAKLHGTSGRTHKEEIPESELPVWKQRVRRWLGGLGKALFPAGTRVLTGTRHTIVQPNKPGLYGSNEFRVAISEAFGDLLLPGETVYYEVVGETPSGSRIQPNWKIPSAAKDLIAKYGHSMPFTYGCKPGECAVYVYNITQDDGTGQPRSLTRYDLTARCEELGLEQVPRLAGGFFRGADDLLAKCEELAERPSVVDASHIEEGVVVRVESPDGEVRFLKYKSFSFCLLEDYARAGGKSGKDEYVDIEEVS